MCDILIAGPEITKERIFIFAKNSDRDPNEAQILELIKDSNFQDDKIKLTYTTIEISKVNSLKNSKSTNSILLSRPWWMWGAEMGANDKGVVVGNTAVFTKKVSKKPGILGMDMIRLALMFKSTAVEVAELITELVEKFDQGGNGSYEHKLFYDNSFIIADPNEAYLIETAGNSWVVKRVEKSYSISNKLTIERNWDRCSNDISNFKNFNFAKNLSDKLFTFFAHGFERCKFTSESLNRDGIDLLYMIKILSSTGIKNGKFIHVSPEEGSMRDICMHYGGLLRPSQTASSQISELHPDLQVHWVTGTSLPCLSIFKPVYLISGLPNLERDTKNRYSLKSYWWTVEKFHRKFQFVYKEFIDEYSQERDVIQMEIIEMEREVRSKYLKGKAKSEELYKLTELAFNRERMLISKWEKHIEKVKLRGKLFYKLVWFEVNRKAAI